MSTPTTRIGTSTSQTDVLKMRGKDSLSEIVGERTFSEAFYFIVTSRMPSAGQLRCFDACLTVLMDHGITPSAAVTRLVEDSVPDDIQVPIAAGILTVGNKFVGAMAGVGQLLKEGIDAGGDAHAWAGETVAKFRESGRRIPGFGHPYYRPEDPRSARLLAIAGEAGVAGPYIERLKVLSAAVDEAAGRHITLNVTGVIGALLGEIGFPAEVMRAVAVVSRAAGLVAHILEEKQVPVTPAIVDTVNAVPYEDPE